MVEETLLQDDENYRHTLQAYYGSMKQLKPQREWMSEKLGPRLGEIFNRKKDVRVLAVGTGAGEVDIDFLNEIVKRAKAACGDEYSVTYQVVEPNPSSVEYFRNSVAKIDDFRNVKFQWFTGFYDAYRDEFLKTESEETKFDFVHYVRVFYHVDSVPALKMTYEHFLAKDGIVAVVGENKNAFWPKQMLFLNNHEMKHECFTCAGPVSQAYFLPGWESQAIENEWKYETHTQVYNFDVTNVYNESSKAGNYVLDFCMHVKDARKSLSKEVLDDFFKMMDENVKDEEVEEEGKMVMKKHFKCELGAIIITKA